MLKKFITSAFAANALIAPMAAGAVVLSAAPALAEDPPVACYYFEVICDRKNPTNCRVTEPIEIPCD